MSCNTLSTKIRQIKAKIQTVGDGCEWDEPQDTDLIKGLEYGAVNALDVENIESNIAKSSFTKETPQAGISFASVDVSFRLMGGDYSAGEHLNVHNLIIGNGHASVIHQAIPVSAIATPFVVGETVTGGNSGATGIVVKDTEGTDTFILIKTLTSVFEAEALTGNLSGTATATGASTASGDAYTPISTGHQKLSVILEEFNNMKTELYNAVFIGVISQDDSGLASYAGQVIGAIRVVTGIEQYRRDFAVVPLPQDITTRPAIYKNARYKIDDWAPVVSGTTTLDFAASSTQRRNANSETGLEGMFIGDRVPIHTVRFELVPNSEYDIYQDRLKVNTSVIQYYLGNTLQNIIYFHYPKATPTESPDEDQDNIAMVGATYNLSGNNDDEYSLVTF